MDSERRFKDSLPPEFRVTNLLLENKNLLSENLKEFLESNIEDSGRFLRIIQIVNETRENPPVVFITKDEIDTPAQEELAQLGDIDDVVMIPDNLPELNSDEIRISKEISETVFEDIPPKVIEIAFKYMILSNQIQPESKKTRSTRKMFRSLLSPDLRMSNPQELAKKRVKAIFQSAKEESARKEWIQGDRFEEDKNHYYHDMGVYRSEVKKGFLKLNREHKKAIRKYGLGEFLKEQLQEQKAWKGESEYVPIRQASG